MNKIKNTINYSRKHINYKMGNIAGLISGIIVGWINWDYGLLQSAFSAGKQYLYNLFIAGYNVKTCEKLISKIDNKYLAILAGTFIPSAQAFAIVYAIHKFGRTPEPFNSSIWQLYVNLPIYAVLSLYYKKQNNITGDEHGKSSNDNSSRKL